jgi:uncharacterized protein with PQ loop repeat
MVVTRELQRQFRDDFTSRRSSRMSVSSYLAPWVVLWTAYGFLRSDIVITIANAISFALLMSILYVKLRERHTSE